MQRSEKEGNYKRQKSWLRKNERSKKIQDQRVTPPRVAKQLIAAINCFENCLYFVDDAFFGNYDIDLLVMPFRGDLGDDL